MSKKDIPEIEEVKDQNENVVCDVSAHGGMLSGVECVQPGDGDVLPPGVEAGFNVGLQVESDVKHKKFAAF